MIIPFASLLLSDKKTPLYCVRFNASCMRAFGGANYCLVRMTEGGKYLVIIPIRQVMPEKTMTNSRITYERGRCPKIYLNKYVTSGLIRKDLFGHRYKVKKDKRGYIYVCLAEPLEIENE